MIVEKDAAVEQQAKEIHRLDNMIIEKDAAVEQQAKEIHRLENFIFRSKIFNVHRSNFFRILKIFGENLTSQLRYFGID